MKVMSFCILFTLIYHLFTVNFSFVGFWVFMSLFFTLSHVPHVSLPLCLPASLDSTPNSFDSC